MRIIKILFVLLVLSLVSVLDACNTVQGAGEDLQAGGHAISKAASDAKD